MNFESLTLGADIELVFEKNGEIIPASSLVGYRDCGFGTDGNSDIAEIRPGYSSKISELLAKIEKTIQIADKRAEFSKKVDSWLAGHYKFNRPIGAHLHITYPGVGQDSKILRDIAFLCDHYIEDCFEDIIAPKEERIQRQFSGYGKLYRDDSNCVRGKTKDRIEYRSPGSWILHPLVAYSYLFITKAIIKMYGAGQADTNFLKPLPTKREKIGSLLNFTKNALEVSPKEKEMYVGYDILSEIVYQDLDWDADIREGWLD